MTKAMDLVVVVEMFVVDFEMSKSLGAGGTKHRMISFVQKTSYYSYSLCRKMKILASYTRIKDTSHYNDPVLKSGLVIAMQRGFRFPNLPKPGFQ